jgi:hypothetical protein
VFNIDNCDHLQSLQMQHRLVQLNTTRQLAPVLYSAAYAIDQVRIAVHLKVQAAQTDQKHRQRTTWVLHMLRQGRPRQLQRWKHLRSEEIAHPTRGCLNFHVQLIDGGIDWRVRAGKRSLVEAPFECSFSSRVKDPRAPARRNHQCLLSMVARMRDTFYTSQCKL